MKQERVILSFIMVVIGLLVAGIAFYFYQSTKVVSPTNTKQVVTLTPSPTPKPMIYLNIDQPVDESVTDNKTLQISGQTNPDADVLIITNSGQQVIQPTSDGNFVTTITLDDGQNQILIESLLPDGEITSVQRTITYSTENF